MMIVWAGPGVCFRVSALERGLFAPGREILWSRERASQGLWRRRSWQVVSLP